MSSFITETTDLQPRILVIGTQGVLTDLVVQFFHDNHIAPVLATVHQVVEWGRAGVQKRDFYKIIWVDPEGEKKLLQELAPFQEKIVIVSFWQTAIISTHNTFHDWNVSSEKETAYWQQFLEEMPDALFLVGQDVLRNAEGGGEVIADAPHTPLHFFLLSLAKNELIDPVLDLYFQDELQFFHGLKSFLLAPIKRKKILIRGGKIKSSDVLRKIEKLQFEHSHHHLEIHEVPVEEYLFPLDQVKEGKKFLVEHALALFIEKYIHVPEPVKKVERVVAEEPKKFVPPANVIEPVTPPAPLAPAAKKSIDVGEKDVTQKYVHQHKKIAMPAQSIPLIENRLKKYERRMEEVAKQQHFSKYLRQVPPQAPVSLHTSLTKQKNKKRLKKEAEIDAQIHSLFSMYRQTQKVERVKTKTVQKIRKKTREKKNNVLFWFFVLLMALGAGGGLLWGTFFLTKTQVVEKLTTTYQSFTANTSSPSPVNIFDQTADQVQSLEKMTKFFAWQINAYSSVMGKESLSDSTDLLTTSQESTDMVSSLMGLRQQATTAVQQFFNKQQGSLADTLLSLSSKSQEAYGNLSLLQTQVKSMANGDFTAAQQNIFSAFANDLQEKRKTLVVAQQTSQFLPSLLGLKGKKTYLVLLQNNQELRPTGGFIESVALVTVDKGSLVDYQVFDSSTVDSSFHGQMAAPQEIQNYLGQKQWFFRDSNWSPNFPDVAQKAEFFVQQSLGKKPDGVIAMNLIDLQDLLHATGPVNLPDYNEVVTEQNIFERAEFHSEIKLVQPNQKGYLSTLFERVIQHVSDVTPDRSVALLSALYGDLRSGQMLMYSNDTDVNGGVGSLGWSGEVSTPPCPTILSDTSCFVDTMMQVEANVGVNKANAYIQRTIDQSIHIDAGEVHHDRTVAFTNTATSNGWPLGSYKMFLRFYVPQAARLDDLQIDGSTVQQSSIIVGQDAGKKYFGVYVEVPIQRTVSVHFLYSESIAQNKPFSYAFFEQKQSGTDKDPYIITFLPDATLQPVLVAPQAQVIGSTVRFTGVRDKHVYVGVKFN